MEGASNQSRANPAIGFVALISVVLAAVFAPQFPARQADSLGGGSISDAASRLFAETGLITVDVPTAAALERAFNHYGFDWPPQPGDTVPPIMVDSLPDDLSDVKTDHRKSLFFRALLPIVLAEDRQLLRMRRFLKRAFAKKRLIPSGKDWERVQALARHFRVDGDPNDSAVRAQLLRRVDTVPPALVLAQAANESGWGTSRFAQEGNSLFGLWTYRSAAGIEPNDRSDGARHSVRTFPDLRSAVRSYLYNLNVGHAYLAFRGLRAAMRAQGRPLNALDLAVGLEHYSSRGDDYVAAIRQLILGNGLAHLNQLHLAIGPPAGSAINRD